MLEYLKKRTTTINDNRRAIELANRYNIPTMGSFMIGNPNETENDMIKTLKFIRSYRYSPFLSPLSYIATAFPGTELWDYAKTKGINVDNFDDIVMDIPNNAASLKKAPLLTNIPLDRFFTVAQLFAKETTYGGIKRHIFLPDNSFSLIRAYLLGIRLEKNVITGIIEVTKIIVSFIKYKRIAHIINK